MSNIAREKIADIAMAQTGANDEQSWALADAILAALPDMIAPLVWVNSDMAPGLLCDAINGRYQIQDSGLGWCCMKATGKRRPEGDDVPTFHSSEGQAKAAANAHHRAAIMAAFNGEAKT
jgi:hypothetical protein